MRSKLNKRFKYMSKLLKLYVLALTLGLAFEAFAQTSLEVGQSHIDDSQSEQFLEIKEDSAIDLKRPLPEPLTTLVHSLLSPEDLEL